MQDFHAKRINFEVFTKAQLIVGAQTTKKIAVRAHRIKTVLVHNKQGAEVAPPDDVTVDVLVKVKNSDDFVPLSTASGGAAVANKIFPFSFEDALEEIQVKVTAGATKPESCSVTILGA